MCWATCCCLDFFIIFWGLDAWFSVVCSQFVLRTTQTTHSNHDRIIKQMSTSVNSADGKSVDRMVSLCRKGWSFSPPGLLKVGGGNDDDDGDDDGEKG